MTKYRVEQLDGYGPDPDIVDVTQFASLEDAESWQAAYAPARIVKVDLTGRCYYRRFGRWIAESDMPDLHSCAPGHTGA